jgi:hypothetical protein
MSENQTKQTTCYGHIPLTTLPWQLQGHLDIKCMEEWENCYKHPPSGAFMVVHYWRYPQERTRQVFFWGEQEFTTEEELIQAIQIHFFGFSPTHTEVIT